MLEVRIRAVEPPSATSTGLPFTTRRFGVPGGTLRTCYLDLHAREVSPHAVQRNHLELAILRYDPCSHRAGRGRLGTGVSQESNDDTYEAGPEEAKNYWQGQ